MLCIDDMQMHLNYFFLQVFGHRVDDDNLGKVLEAINIAGDLVQPTGLNVLLDIIPWLHYFPNTTYARLQEAQNLTKDWFTAEIHKTKVRAL